MMRMYTETVDGVVCSTRAFYWTLPGQGRLGFFAFFFKVIFKENDSHFFCIFFIGQRFFFWTGIVQLDPSSFQSNSSGTHTTDVRTYVRTYAHTYTHRHTHIHLHTHTHIQHTKHTNPGQPARHIAYEALDCCWK